MTKITPIAQLRHSIIVTFLENKSKYNFQNIIETAVVILEHVRFRVYILVEIFEVRNFFSGKLFRLKFYKSGFPGYFSSFYEFLILYVCFAPKLLFVRRFWKLWVIFEIFFSLAIRLWSHLSADHSLDLECTSMMILRRNF